MWARGMLYPLSPLSLRPSPLLSSSFTLLLTFAVMASVLGARPEAESRRLERAQLLLLHYSLEESFSIQQIPGSGLGVVAEVEFGEGEDLFEIPRRDLWSSSGVLRSPLGPMMSASGARGRSVLAVQLMFESLILGKEELEESASSLFVSTLPHPEELDSPFFWEQHELLELEGSWVFDRLEADYQALEQDFQEIFTEGLSLSSPELFPPELFTWENYVWAWNIIWSRSLNVEDPDTDAWTSFLVPGADFINHSNDPNVEFYVDGDSGALTFRALRTISPGEELTRQYLPVAYPDETLRLFGFVDSSSDLSRAHVGASLSEDDPFYKDKQQWLESYDVLLLPYPYDQSLVVTDEGISALIPTLFRVALFEYTYEHQRAPSSLPSPQNAISNPLEKTVQKILIGALQDQLDSYPTTIEEDIEVLAKNSSSSPISLRKWLALQVRVSEKRALILSLEQLEEERVVVEDVDEYVSFDEF
eukprot:TRINITY_DN7041_c0_g1_i1.p1 TRINITY_DN7041_c0_g1~~TRINITY_DN7041_c0_g1_i1.p1  ORF type:complete len:476 (-),score=86.92 TRINITY_DN7041_c0_g1_i1:62-1489(-)